MNTPRTALEELPEGLPSILRAIEERLVWGMDYAKTSLERKNAMNDALKLTRQAASTHGKALSEALGGWRPIETAPKDEQILLLIGGKFVSVGGFDDDRYSKKPRPYWRTQRAAGRTLVDRDCQPTHWRPLPPPPTSAKGSGVTGG